MYAQWMFDSSRLLRVLPNDERGEQKYKINRNSPMRAYLGFVCFKLRGSIWYLLVPVIQRRQA